MKFPPGIFDSSNCRETEQLSQRIIIKLIGGKLIWTVFVNQNPDDESFDYSIISSTDDVLAGAGGGGVIGTGILGVFCGFV